MTPYLFSAALRVFFSARSALKIFIRVNPHLSAVKFLFVYPNSCATSFAK